MSGRAQPPFRAEHVGSLLRPQELMEKRIALEREGKSFKEIPLDSELQALEGSAIADLVRLQLDIGFASVTDGECRRREFWGAFYDNLQGFEQVKYPLPKGLLRSYVPDSVCWSDESLAPISGTLFLCTGKIKHVGSALLHEWNTLKSLLPAESLRVAKISLPSPEIFHLRYNPGRAYPKDAYASDAEYLADVALAYRTELQTLYDAGCRNVTIDDPNLGYFCDQSMITGFKEAGEDIDALFDSYIKLYNDCIVRPADMHLAMHVCRGNALSRHVAEGGYDPISTKFFQEVNCNTYYLEYDTSRSGTFEPLAKLPAHKNVVLGVISSKFPELEDVAEMKEKILLAAEHMARGAGQTKEEALKRISISPQCGFASSHLGNIITRDDMIAKLKLVRELADQLWPGEA